MSNLQQLDLQVIQLNGQTCPRKLYQSWLEWSSLLVENGNKNNKEGQGFFPVEIVQC